MTPNEVNLHNQSEVRKNLYGTHDLINSYENPLPLAQNRKRRTFGDAHPLGSYVRISKYKTIFGKGYTTNYTTEVFRIIKRNVSKKGIKRRIPILYTLVDARNNILDGKFYGEELVKVSP
jgi:hypothetical protein